MKTLKPFVIAIGVCAAAASQAFSFTLDAITFTTADNTSEFFVYGTMTVEIGETFDGYIQHDFAFLPDFSAGFNSTSAIVSEFNNFTGPGTYTGPVIRLDNISNNFGYNNGMPVGLYNSNPGSTDLLPGLIVGYHDVTGLPQEARANYAIQVDAVPEPATLSLLALAGITAFRKRRK